jgi:hypothetical protein
MICVWIDVRALLEFEMILICVCISVYAGFHYA